MSNFVIDKLGRRLRLGVIGGGPGSFIGPVHRRAATLDDRFEVAAACLSTDPVRSEAAAASLGVAANRRYGDWAAMLEAEKGRDDGIDVVAVMTPNHLHVPQAMRALELGFDVICDKPLAINLEDCRRLIEVVKETGRVFAVTYNYSQYPMVRQARAMVKEGAIGEIRQLHMTYVQGNSAKSDDEIGAAQKWRFDPAKAGPSRVLGDIGTHAYHLGAYVADLTMTSVMADIAATVPGRTSDDYASLLTRWSNGAHGTLWVTNAVAGAEHGLAFKICGSKGTLEWEQEQPSHLLHRRLDDFPVLQTRRLHGSLEPMAEHASRIEIGHPEGYQEAFANIYRDVADLIACRRLGLEPPAEICDFPDVFDGARGLAMIEAAVESVRTRSWVDVAVV